MVPISFKQEQQRGTHPLQEQQSMGAGKGERGPFLFSLGDGLIVRARAAVDTATQQLRDFSSTPSAKKSGGVNVPAMPDNRNMKAVMIAQAEAEDTKGAPSCRRSPRAHFSTQNLGERQLAQHYDIGDGDTASWVQDGQDEHTKPVKLVVPISQVVKALLQGISTYDK
jgi:hypothetical protein